MLPALTVASLNRHGRSGGVAAFVPDRVDAGFERLAKCIHIFAVHHGRANSKHAGRHPVAVLHHVLMHSAAAINRSASSIVFMSMDEIKNAHEWSNFPTVLLDVRFQAMYDIPGSVSASKGDEECSLNSESKALNCQIAI